MKYIEIHRNTWKFVVLVLGIAIGFFLRDILREKPAMAKLVTIQSRGLDFQVATTAVTVEELLTEQGYLSPSSLRDGGEGKGVRQGMVVTILKPFSITFIDAGNELTATTTAMTVGDFLNEQKIGLAQTDRVQPELGSYLADKTRIVIDRIVDLEVTEKHEIPFEIRLSNDPALFYGHEEVIIPGQVGEKEQKFLITYKNGVEIRRKLLATRIITPASPETRLLGTKIEIEESTEGRASWYATKTCLSTLGGCVAHPFYDFGRYVRVTALASGKSIIVQINDRGPDPAVHPDRVIDLDSTAFRALAPLGAGTISVRVELLKN